MFSDMGENFFFEFNFAPSAVSLQTAGELIQLTGGGGHTTLLTSRGRLLVCGWNKNGQLAVQPYKDVTAL